MFCALLSAVVFTACRNAPEPAAPTARSSLSATPSVAAEPGVPAPPSAAASPDLLRLLDRFAAAEKKSTWVAPPRGSDIVTSIPATVLRSSESRLKERDIAWFVLHGFQFSTADVGKIVFRGRLTNARFFTIQWARGGVLRVDVDPSTETREIAVSTDGLAAWKGNLRMLRIGLPPALPSQPSPEFALDAIELHRKTSIYADPAGVARPMLSRELRSVIYVHSNGTVRFNGLQPPPNAKLSFALAAGAAGVRIRVVANHPSGEKTLFDEPVPQPQRFVEKSVALPADAPGPLDLTFHVEGPDGVVGLVADPVIYRPQTSPRRAILYLIDTLAAPHMSLYGYERKTTPRLEKLAAEGAWFAQMFANATRTQESVPNMMLSEHTRTHGIVGTYDRAASNAESIAAAFHRAGYATACIVTNANAGPQRGMDLGFDSFFDHVEFGWETTKTSPPRTVPVDRAVAWLEAHRDRPVFFYIHTAEPHMPYTPPPPLDKLFDPDYRGHVDGMVDTASPQYLAASPEDVRHLIALYDGEIVYADRKFGEFFDAAKSRGLLDNAILALTADHGEEFMQHKHRGHGKDVHAETQRVPLIFWGPGLIPPKGRIDNLAQMIDVKPTFVELFNLTAARPMQGDSLAPLLRGESPGHLKNRVLLAASYEPIPPHRALIRWPYKLISTGRPTFELFDIAADPREFNDLASSKPDLVNELAAELGKRYSAIPEAVRESGRHTVDHAFVDQLKKLGYIAGDNAPPAPPPTSSAATQPESPN